MSTKYEVVKECDRRNKSRNVSDGTVGGEAFFQKIYGDLLMSGGYACQMDLLLLMIRTYLQKGDLPVVILSSRPMLLECLREMQNLQVFAEKTKSYHPMYGMQPRQICRLLNLIGEEWGCSALMDKVLLYAMAVMETVHTKYEISLPAMMQLLKFDDYFVAEVALQAGLSMETADSIRGSKEAGTLLRRMMEHLQVTFAQVAEQDSETEKCLWKTGRDEMYHAAFYQYSQNQKLMNAYLKEELSFALKHSGKLRVIADEILTTGEDDELVRFLMEMKRVGKIELILCSGNARTILKDEELNFTNACVFTHASVSAMEKVSDVLFGRYLFHYPVQTVGRPPNFLFTLKKDEHWTFSTEDRLKVREADLYEDGGMFGRTYEKMAIKIGQKNQIFLVPVEEFVCGHYRGLLAIERRGNGGKK